MLLIKPFVLNGGQQYTITVNGSTPGSHIGTTDKIFLMNRPPYGGKCDVTPKEGKFLYSDSCYILRVAVRNRNFIFARGNKGTLQNIRVHGRVL